MKIWQSLVIGVILGLIIGGAIFLVASPNQKPELAFIPPTQLSRVTVSVTGEVIKPGLYSLPIGSRVNDAILLAGGFTISADNTEINLAEPLEDGIQIRVPSKNAESVSQTNDSQSKININQATLEELDKLPGIGQEKAQAIIDYRNNNGQFNSIEDLLYVNGFGPSIFDLIKEMIVVK
ncbi:MAG: helix-hairpin-helix domain-containing protein [Anaerolineaceae bacterium]